MWIWHGFAGFVGGLQKHMDLLEGQADHLVREDLHGFAIFTSLPRDEPYFNRLHSRLCFRSLDIIVYRFCTDHHLLLAF